MSNGRIAIIGAGPSGAIALDTFLKEGFEDIVVYERHRVVGGTWNLDEHLGFENDQPIPGNYMDKDSMGAVQIPTEILDGILDRMTLPKDATIKPLTSGSSLYPQVETNVLADLMAFSNKELPNDFPERSKSRYGDENTFRSHQTIREYVSSYFENRMHLVQLNTSVEKAWQPDGPGGKWRLVLRQNTENSTELFTETFDFLYVASGRFSVPNVPAIEGLEDAIKTLPNGSIIHSKVFRDPSKYRGKKVIFVGSGFSNIDLVHLTKDAGAKLPVHLSLRSVLLVALPGFAQPWIQTHAQVKRIKATENDKIGLDFEDGTQENDVDIVILGTGYKYSYPFLNDYLKDYDGGITATDGRRSQNLFWSTWWKFDPSLVVSSSITDSVFWAFLERQSKAAAGVWNKPREEWPTVEEAELWEEKRLSKGLKDFHTWWPYFDELFLALAQHGKHDPGDVSVYLPLLTKGFELKGAYWKRLAEDWLKEHPEDTKPYEKTFQFLEKRIITRIGL